MTKTVEKNNKSGSKNKNNYVRIYDRLTKQQKDILGEVANISMGSAATSLSKMVNCPVSITSPRIETMSRSEALKGFTGICTFVQVSYVTGLFGNNVFVSKDKDLLNITDLMLGGTGSVDIGSELNDLHLSAASEAMNQMIGTSATSMSGMLAESVDISTPMLSRIDIESIKTFDRMFESSRDIFVRIEFDININNRIRSTMIQLYPIQLAIDICKLFKKKKFDRKTEDQSCL